jgi:transcriptional regulator with XRE-family HTH domain
MGTVHVVGTRDGWAPIADEQEQRAGFGEWLRRAREARGLTLDSIIDQTRIPRRHLEAIEHGDLSYLPEFYERAEIRAFARAVGVDEQLALARFESAVAPAPPVEHVAAPVRRQRVSVRYSAIALGAAAVVLAAVAGRTVSNQASDTPEPATSPRTPVQAVPPIEAARAGDAVVQPDAPVPVRAQPAAEAELIVRTQPPGARVTVNGIGWGTSPIAIKHLPPGDKRIRVSKDGYGSAERVFALDEGRRAAIDITLVAAP